MSDVRAPDDAAARPTDPASSAALPLDVQWGGATVAVTGEYEIAGLLHDSLPRTIARVALPAVASNLLMTVFGSVDAYWVGTRVGATGLAAVSTSIFWIWMLISLAEMVSVGLTALAARRYGERRRAEAARTVGEALAFALLLGVIVAGAGLLYLDELFALLGTPADVTAMGRAYLGTYLIGTPLIFGFFVVDAGFRAAGDTRTPFFLLAASVAVTIAIDPILILGLCGVPALGVKGAAVATVATRSLAFLFGVGLLWHRGLLTLGPIRQATIRTIARIGLPTAATGVTFSLIYVALTRTTTTFGTPALAALGLGHRIEGWLYMVGVGFGAAAAAIVGQNLGAGQPERAERAGWLIVAYASVLGTFAFVLEIAFAEELAGIFSNEPAVIAETASYLRIAAVSQLFICAEIILEGALGGAGDTLPPMLASTVLTASRIPLAAWAASEWGTAGIWWVISITAAARGIAMLGIWRLGRWKRRLV